MTDASTIVYVAGPLFTQAEWQWNAQLAAELRRLGFDIILPQERAEPMLRGEERFDARKLFLGNVADIDSSHIVLAVLDGTDPDSVTSWEIGYAYKAGRPVVGLRTDLRAGGDDANGAVNLMLSQSCSEFVSLPLDKRNDTSWFRDHVAEAIRRAYKSRKS